MSAVGLQRGEHFAPWPWRRTPGFHRCRPHLTTGPYVKQKFVLITFPDRRQYLLNASLLAAAWAARQAAAVRPLMQPEIFWYCYNHCYSDDASLRKLFTTAEEDLLCNHACPLNTSERLNEEDWQLLPQCKIVLINRRVYPHQEYILHHRGFTAEGSYAEEPDCPEALEVLA
ncbi:hypothetical protein [Candidatus Methanomassiliicoccus intestinalis]|uniref:hypothetical protein n=1 Tax=Candidatus Methanomassiliicoccus intestinalis TaxID=1406512 RepID=UPI0037DC4AFD